MRYYIVAGEQSGDMHGGRLIQALKVEDPQAEFRCWGGKHMEQAGGAIAVHYHELALMGLAFLGSLRRLFRYLRYCKKDLLNFQPNVVILIDYAAFNLRVAKFAKKYQIKTFYYISPKVWGWGPNRIHKIKTCVDKMFSIFPFEKAFYTQHNYAVDYVGNPLVEQIELHSINPKFLEDNQLEDKPIIALLPGSRIQEIKRILPAMLSVAMVLREYQFVIAAIRELPYKLYEAANRIAGVHVLYDQVYDILSHAHTAVVTSGTATLETALLKVPQIVVYKTDMLTYALAKRFIKLKYISLVNILAEQRLATELIQNYCNTKMLIRSLQMITQDDRYRKLQIAGYQSIIQDLGSKKASKVAARLMVKYLC